MLIVYYAAYLMLLANFENNQAAMMYGQYMREKNKYVVNRHSQNTGQAAATRAPIRFRVVTS
jgi:hypothetical protein